MCTTYSHTDRHTYTLIAQYSDQTCVAQHSGEWSRIPSLQSSLGCTEFQASMNHRWYTDRKQNAHSTWRHTLKELEQEWPGITRKYFRKNSLCSNSLEPTSKLAMNFWCSCLGLQNTGIMGVGYLPYLANSILICLKFFIIKKEANSISLQRASHATQPTELFILFLN